MISFIKHN